MVDETLKTLLAMPGHFPSDFFSFSFNAEFVEKESDFGAKKRFALPDTSPFLAERGFASFFLGWNYNGLFFASEVDKPYEKSLLPSYQSGDALELFIDTRDIKSAGFVSRFCHHLLILPQPVDGVQSKELTRFRFEEDSHPLPDPNFLKVDCDLHKKSYLLKVFIPAEILHGFDPKSFNRLGFTLCLHQVAGDPQHFALSEQGSSLEQHPALWPSFHLKQS